MLSRFCNGTGAGRALIALLAISLVAGCAPQRGAEPAKPAAPAPAPAAAPAAPAAPGAPAAPAKPADASKPAAGAPTAMTLKFSHVVAKNTPKGKAADRFAEIVKEKSGGKIDVQVYANSELYKDAEELEALTSGAVHFLAPGTDKFAGLAPGWDAIGLPYLFTSEKAAEKLLDPTNPTAQQLFEAMRPKGLLGLAVWANGFKHFSDSKKPLKAPADFQGLKIRTSGKTDESFVKALGGSAQVMAFSEVFGALQQGVVDGQFNTWSNIYTQKFHEIQKYATISRGGVYLAYGVATNAKWWDGLDADSKKILTDAMKEATVFEKELSDKDNADALAEIKKSGRMEFYEQTEADVKAFQEPASKVVAEWEPKVGKELVDKLRAMNN